MASNRIQRINEDVQRCLSGLIREIKDPRVNQGMISITGVDVTGDLRWCKVYISVLGLQNEKEFLKGLRSASGWLRKELGHALSLRYTPELVFQLDKSIEYGAHINRVINELDIREDETDEDGHSENS